MRFRSHVVSFVLTIFLLYSNFANAELIDYINTDSTQGMFGTVTINTDNMTIRPTDLHFNLSFLQGPSDYAMSGNNFNQFFVGSSEFLLECCDGTTYRSIFFGSPVWRMYSDTVFQPLIFNDIGVSLYWQYWKYDTYTPRFYRYGETLGGGRIQFARVVAVPEPGNMSMLGFGMFILFMYRRFQTRLKCNFQI